MTQEVTAPTEKVESTPEATPEVTPEVTEPTPTEGETPATEETAEATAEATEEPESSSFDPSSYEADDHPQRESFQQWKQEQRSQGWAEARESYSGEMAKQTERQDGLTRLYEGATQSYKTVLGRLDKALSQGQVDREALTEVFQDPNFTRATEAIGKQAQDGAKEQGVVEGRVLGGISAASAFIQIASKELGRQALAQEYLPEIEKSGREPIDTEALVKNFIAKVKDIGYQQGLADNKTGTTEATRVAERKGQKPAQNVGTAGGGKSAAENLKDLEWVKTASVAELMSAKAEVATAQ